MYLLIVFLPLLGSSVAGFFGHFFVESYIINGQNLILLAILLLGLILISRFYSSRMPNKYLRLVFYISILFSIYIFSYFLRIYLLSQLGLFFSFLILSVLPGGQALPLPGPSSPAHSSPSTEDSFGIQVLSEPWPILPNLSLESSMQARIGVLENANSIFLLDKERGQYWSEVKQTLDQAPSQQEYNRLLEFENRDLQIRERKTECYSLVREILFHQPALMENSQYSTPEMAIQQFCEDTRTDLEAEDEHRLGLHSGNTDRAEIEIYVKVAKDLRKNGPQSFYFQKILYSQ